MTNISFDIEKTLPDEKYVEDERQTILVVDDAPENNESIGNLLVHDYRIQVAIDGREAVEIARRKPQPDLILLDIMVPDIDGIRGMPYPESGS